MFATMFREDLPDFEKEARNILPNVIDKSFGCTIFGHQKSKAYSPMLPSAILYLCDRLRFPRLEAFLLGRNERARTAISLLKITILEFRARNISILQEIVSCWCRK